MLVGDVPDDLLDHVLEGDDAGRSPYSSKTTAIWPSCRSSVEQRVEAQRVGTTIGRRHQCLTRVVCRSGMASGDGMLDVHGPDDVVVVVRAPGTGSGRCAGQLDDRPGAVVDVEAHRPDAGRHDLAGRAAAELHPAFHQLGGLGVERALLGGRWMSEASSVERTRRAQLLLWLHAEPSHDGVGRAVEEPDGQAHHGGEVALEALGGARRLHRPGDRHVLGDQLAEDHGRDGAEDQADRHRHRVDGARRQPGGSSGPAIRSAMAGSARKPMARLVIVMPTWAPESCVDRVRRAFWTPAAAGVTGLGGPGDLAAVDGDEGELRRHEDPAATTRSTDPPSRIHDVSTGTRPTRHAGGEGDCRSRPWAGQGPSDSEMLRPTLPSGELEQRSRRPRGVPASGRPRGLRVVRPGVGRRGQAAGEGGRTAGERLSAAGPRRVVRRDLVAGQAGQRRRERVGQDGLGRRRGGRRRAGGLGGGGRGRARGGVGRRVGGRTGRAVGRRVGGRSGRAVGGRRARRAGRGGGRRGRRRGRGRRRRRRGKEGDDDGEVGVVVWVVWCVPRVGCARWWWWRCRIREVVSVGEAPASKKSPLLAGYRQDGREVHVAVVVAQDRLAQATGGAQVTVPRAEVDRCPEGRVVDVLHVTAPVAVRVDGHGGPRGREELHRADRRSKRRSPSRRPLSVSATRPTPCRPSEAYADDRRGVHAVTVQVGPPA